MFCFDYLYTLDIIFVYNLYMVLQNFNFLFYNTHVTSIYKNLNSKNNQ